jgi:hypothetical protein
MENEGNEDIDTNKELIKIVIGTPGMEEEEVKSISIGETQNSIVSKGSSESKKKCSGKHIVN